MSWARLHRTPVAAGLAGLLAGLALQVAMAGSVPPADDSAGVTRLPAQSTGPQPPPIPSTTFTTTETSVTGRHGPLPATLRVPVTTAPAPGVVMVAGSGAGPRSSMTDAATALASRGVAVLTYDKDLVGYSAFERDYVALAADAAAAVSALRTTGGVDAGRVGVWGFSEGGWVGSHAAARDPGIAFVVSVSGPTVSPGEQLEYTVARFLAEHGLGGLRRVASLQLALGQPWFTHTGYRPPLGQVRQPFLALFGAQDPTVPGASAVARLDHDLPIPPAVVVLDGAGHDLTGSDAAADLVADVVAGWVHQPVAFHWVKTAVNQRVGLAPDRALPVAALVALHAANLLLLGGIGVLGLAVVAGGLRRVLTRRTTSRRSS